MSKLIVIAAFALAGPATSFSVTVPRLDSSVGELMLHGVCIDWALFQAVVFYMEHGLHWLVIAMFPSPYDRLSDTNQALRSSCMCFVRGYGPFIIHCGVVLTWRLHYVCRNVLSFVRNVK